MEFTGSRLYRLSGATVMPFGRKFLLDPVGQERLNQGLMGHIALIGQ